MKILLPFGLLFAIALGCANRSEQSNPSGVPTATPSGRVVANNQTSNPKARFLGQAAAYLANVFQSDSSMVTTFTSGDGKLIQGAIQSAIDAEKREFALIEKAPKSYGDIEQKLAAIHNSQRESFLDYLKVFLQPSDKQMDKANARMKRSLYQIDECSKLVNSTLKRDFE